MPTRCEEKKDIIMCATASQGGKGANDGDEAIVVKCHECKIKEAIYQCPRCHHRTCSLECCRNHKSRLRCNGKRDRSAFLPICRMNDSTLRSDFFFLEEVMGQIGGGDGGGGKRLKLHDGSSSGTAPPTTNFDIKKNGTTLAKKYKRLLQQAKNRGITLQFMPPIMERHKCNTSWYCAPRDCITWRIDVLVYPRRQLFHFQQSEKDDNILDRIRMVCKEEQASLNRNNSLLMEDGVSYRLFLKRLPSSAKNPRYVELLKSDTLKDVLEGMTIIEYPTIHCVPDSDQVMLSEFPVGSDKVVEVFAGTTSTIIPGN